MQSQHPTTESGSIDGDVLLSTDSVSESVEPVAHGSSTVIGDPRPATPLRLSGAQRRRDRMLENVRATIRRQLERAGRVIAHDEAPPRVPRGRQGVARRDGRS